MRSLRRSSRGLSEIVGTLMLVLIVVTAATAFAAFVASYQKQLQTQEAQAHARALESFKVLYVKPSAAVGTALTTVAFPPGMPAVVSTISEGPGTVHLILTDAGPFAVGDTVVVTSSALIYGPSVAMSWSATVGPGLTGPCAATESTATLNGSGCELQITALGTINVQATADGTTIGSIQLTLASLSVNPSGIAGILIDSAPLVNYTASGDVTDQLNLSATTQFTVAAFGQVVISASFPPNPISLDLSRYVAVDVLTSLANSFQQVFVPPTAVAQVSTIQTVVAMTPETVPLLDGSNSFPAGNATIVSWAWTVTLVSGIPSMASCAGTFAGEQIVVSNLCQSSPAVVYDAELTVTDSTGLIGTSSTGFSY